MTYDVLTQGYKSLRAEYNLTADDRWGDSLSWHFAVAEILFHNGYSLPREWEFHDSPLHHDWSPDDYQTVTINEMLMNDECTYDDVLSFGHVLFRYLTILRDAGKDY